MSVKIYIVFLYFLKYASAKFTNDEIRRFPDNFQFGVATASFQIEGGWNAAGKGESIWDRLSHTTNLVEDGSNADIACDSYNLHKRDVEMLVELGVDFYRFSISWGRILPDGFGNRVSQEGINYYDTLIDDLLAANITPYITLYHWDLPQPLQEVGGWANSMIIESFVSFADVLFKAFSDRVKNWVTFNEPWLICHEGYGKMKNAPVLNMSGIADYLCGHNLLKAHAEVYHLYDQVFRPIQGGRIGITYDAVWPEPETNTAADIEASNIDLQFNVGWLAHPIFSAEGDYPQVMKDRVAAKSLEQGCPKSRLPEFTQEEVNYIKGTSDFFGLNHYTTYMAKMPTDVNETNEISFVADKGVITYYNSSWISSSSSWLKIVPWGFSKILNWIKTEYDTPETIIFENGYSNTGGVNDDDRISYLNSYINAMLDAIDDGCDITGYTVWTLMDDFEWFAGYTVTFGLYHVDHNDPNRTRTPKKSALHYKEIIETRTIERNDIYY